MRDLMEIVSFPGVWRVAAKHFSFGIGMSMFVCMYACMYDIDVHRCIFYVYVQRCIFDVYSLGSRGDGRATATQLLLTLGQFN